MILKLNHLFYFEIFKGFQKLIAKKTLGNVPLQLKYAVDDILDKYDDIKRLENVDKINKYI